MEFIEKAPESSRTTLGLLRGPSRSFPPQDLERIGIVPDSRSRVNNKTGPDLMRDQGRKVRTDKLTLMMDRGNPVRINPSPGTYP